MKLAGENPDYATEDLYESIANGKYVSWSVGVHIMKVNLNKCIVLKIAHGLEQDRMTWVWDQHISSLGLGISRVAWKEGRGGIYHATHGKVACFLSA